MVGSPERNSGYPWVFR
ncbi:hypothetical protein LEMLEM_LOCUS21091 [Lemmus lemmus]